MKTVVVSCDGQLSVAEHLNELRSWLAECEIKPRELTMLHVLNFRVVFRAAFDTAEQADRFVAQFG